MGKLRRILVALLITVAPGAGLTATPDQSAWDNSLDPVTKERFIPVELWTGGQWDGTKELKMAKVNTRFGRRMEKQIRGPIEWKHPATGEMLLVYERMSPERDGTKWQLFTINEDRSGLGRVDDARPSLGKRAMSGGLKFPLGYWKEGETRKFAYKHYDGSKESTRVETITISQIDFTYLEIPHCLKFEWTLTDGEGAKRYDRHTYIYCPGKSLVHEIQY